MTRHAPRWTASNPVLVTPDDQTMLVCWVAMIGRTRPRLRWVFVSVYPLIRYIGPAYLPDSDDLDVLVALVRDDWRNRRDLGIDGEPLTSWDEVFAESPTQHHVVRDTP